VGGANARTRHPKPEEPPSGYQRVRSLRGLAVVALLLLAGCSQAPSKDAARPAEPPVEPFSVPAPVWSAGDEWSFRTTNETQSTESALTIVGSTGYEDEAGQAVEETALVGAVRTPERTLGDLYLSLPGHLRSARAGVWGFWYDICAGRTAPRLSMANDDAWREPLLRFPLEPGKTWRVEERLAHVDYQVTEFRVVRKERVEVLAGAFDAVRIEAHMWHPPGFLDNLTAYEGTNEAGARRNGPALVLHYAEAVKTVVRAQLRGIPSLLVHLAVEEPVGMPVDKTDHRTVVQELASYRKLEPPADPKTWLSDLLHPHCPETRAQEAESLARQYELEHPAHITLSPSSLQLQAPGPAQWKASVQDLPAQGKVSWTLSSPCFGGMTCGQDNVIARGEGNSFSAAVERPGAYTVRAEALGSDGRRADRDEGTLTVHQRIRQTLECDAAAWVPGVPEALRCPSVSFPVGHGTALLAVQLATRPGDAVPPGHIVLRDPEGQEVASSTSDRVSALRLDALLSGCGGEGNWTLQWRPAAAVATQAELDVDVRFIPADHAYTWTGDNLVTSC
jgi:hypothetical protein